MKNFKKISRKELKKLYGGESGDKRNSYDSISIGGGGNGDTFKCCNTQTNACGPCGGPGKCDAGEELRYC